MEQRTLKDMVKELDTALNEKYHTYSSYHQDLLEYANRPLSPEEEDPVNDLLKKIQSEFAELNEVYHWILFRTKYAGNAIDSYKKWIDQLIEGGAKYHESSEESVIQ